MKTEDLLQYSLDDAIHAALQGKCETITSVDSSHIFTADYLAEKLQNRASVFTRDEVMSKWRLTNRRIPPQAGEVWRTGIGECYICYAHRQSRELRCIFLNGYTERLSDLNYAGWKKLFSPEDNE